MLSQYCEDILLHHLLAIVITCHILMLKSSWDWFGGRMCYRDQFSFTVLKVKLIFNRLIRNIIFLSLLFSNLISQSVHEYMGSVFHWFISNFALTPLLFIYCSFVKRLAESPPTVLLFIKNVLSNIGPWYLSMHFRISLSVFIRMSIVAFTQIVFVYTKTCGEFDTFNMGTFLIHKKTIFIYLSRKLSG